MTDSAPAGGADPRLDPGASPLPPGGPAWTLRPATPADEPAIRALVRAERLNPTGLTHPTFIVACVGPLVVGAAQIRRHRDGSRELGSLVVAPTMRGRGIGKALIHTLLEQNPGRLHVITGRKGFAAYQRLGFRLVPGHDAPAAIRRNLWIGQFVGLVMRLRGRRPLGLRALERPAPPVAHGPTAQKT